MVMMSAEKVSMESSSISKVKGEVYNKNNFSPVVVSGCWDEWFWSEEAETLPSSFIPN